ncbi:MAG: leucyl aminopeptidase [Deltaproteobacteria bacterium]|nr:leucyl aminopeptidase [Deltaproteobacteria bacterium]
MEIKLREITPARVRSALLAVPVTDKGLEDSLVRTLDRGLHGRLGALVKKSGFKAKSGGSLLVATHGAMPAGHLLLVGVGKHEDERLHDWRVAGAVTAREAARLWADEATFMLPRDQQVDAVVSAVAEGALLNGYRFTKYRSNGNSGAALRTLVLGRTAGTRSAALARAVKRARLAASAVALARDLVNEPPSTATAAYLAEQALASCQGQGLEVEVWGKRKIQQMKLAGLLAVNQGSREEPRFIHMRYRPKGPARKKLALIGKGITFDSGGLSLKPARSMETMKLDMAGGAAVIGVMSVLPELAPEAEVLGLVPATDNLPDGGAQKPGDIIRYRSGKTVEVMNTDAEGRLILADALTLAAAEKPDCMINLATLTGACIVALGNELAGLFSNDDELADRLMACGRDAGEGLWRLPLAAEYREDIKSSVADIKNVGGGSAGAITAALFLQEFVGEVPWAHLDIAGPAFASKEHLTHPKGGTGFGVRTLLNLLSEI